VNDLLEVRNISVSFDGFKAINSLSWSIGYPELRAIIGPNGAGKTTLMDIISGKTKADSGKVLWDEVAIPLTQKSEYQIAKLGIGRKFQRPTIFEEQSVEENIVVSLKNNRGFFAALTYKYTDQEKLRVGQIASTIKLTSLLSKKAGELSHGQKQWLEIGMLLSQDPKLLLIDEPAAGMTTKERNMTVQLLRHLSKTKSIIVVEHDMDFIRNLGCRVTVLHEGSVLAEGSIDHVSKNKEVVEVYLGR
jgi:urea transport system ATP-binding protein